MKIKPLLAAGAATALMLTPGWALAAGGPPAGHGNGDHGQRRESHAKGHERRDAKQRRNHGSRNEHGAMPGPKAGAKAKRRAYGVHCKGQSKKHVKGEKGTPFSRCVTAMAKAAHGKRPNAACRSLSKKHVKGEKGTPYSRCVSAAAKLRHQRRKATREG